MSIEQALVDVVTNLPEDFVAATYAEKFVAELREKDPDALAEWLDAQAVELVSRRLTYLCRKHKVVSNADEDDPRSRFRKAAAVFHDDGDAAALTPFTGPLAAIYVVNDGNVRKHLRDMTADELTYAADSHETLGRSNLFEAAYLRVLRKRVVEMDVATVGEAFTNDQARTIRKELSERVGSAA